jgi:molecular chaperone DnaJ
MVSKEHGLFRRQCNNLYINVPITFTQSAVVTEIKVPKLDGEVTLTVTAGAQTGSVFRLEGGDNVPLQGHERSAAILWRPQS